MRKLLVLIFCFNLFGMSQQAVAEEKKNVDVLLIGGGIMSATLGTYLHELEPGPSIWSSA
jgi:malate dehydrogenase (quinone)